MPLSTPLTLRAAFRQHIQHLRASRLPQRARRPQSTKPKPTAEAEAIPVGSAPVAPVPLWLRLGPLTRAGRAYARAQRARPWATQLATSLVIYLAADLSAQRIGRDEYRPERTARSLAVGAAAAVPSYLWFMWLSRNFNYASHAASIAVKIAVNQTVFTPVFNTYFFGAQALLAGDSAAEALDRVRGTVPVSWVNSWKLWPAVTAVSFTFVPLEYRSVFAGVVAVGWQTYLSYLNSRAEAQEEHAVATAPRGGVAGAPAAVEKEKPSLSIEAQKRGIAA
ncbi:hypothetical protein GGR52DRAFT_143204 [Hypoxylon sp. FL1284]|nr:hypothetical protein GGR52DRAFT_143204 [Hypoxylon sp. FL1284]